MRQPVSDALRSCSRPPKGTERHTEKIGKERRHVHSAWECWCHLEGHVFPVISMRCAASFQHTNEELAPQPLGHVCYAPGKQGCLCALSSPFKTTWEAAWPLFLEGRHLWVSFCPARSLFLAVDRTWPHTISLFYNMRQKAIVRPLTQWLELPRNSSSNNF